MSVGSTGKLHLFQVLICNISENITAAQKECLALAVQVLFFFINQKTPGERGGEIGRE